MPKLPSRRTVASETAKFIDQFKKSPAAKLYKAMKGKAGRKLEDWEIMERKLKARDKKFNY